MGRSRISEEQAVDQDFTTQAELTTVSGYLHNRIRGRIVAEIHPSDGDVMVYSTALNHWYPATISGGELYSHSDLQDLNADDHWLYVPRDGSRGFTSTVSGIDPTAFYHLTTKDYVDTISGTLQEQFAKWHRIHIAATGQLGTGGVWADLGNIYDVPVVVFSTGKDRQMVLMYRIVENMHDVEDPQIIISTASTDVAPQAGDTVRWKFELTLIDYGESLGKAVDLTMSGTQTLDDDPSYLAIETRNSDLTFLLDAINPSEYLHNLAFMKVTRLGNDSLDTFVGDIALSEIWMTYYGT